MRKEELIDTILCRTTVQFNFTRKDYVVNLVDDLEKIGITELPVFSNIAEMIEKTNEQFLPAEELIYKHIRSHQVGRGEVLCVLTIPTAKKAKRTEACDIIESGRVEFKEQVGSDIRFLHTNETIHLLTELRKNLYIIDRGLTVYYPTHELSIDWQNIEIMNRPNEFSAGKLKKLESFFVKLKSKLDEFKFDKWMYDAIKKEDFTFDGFSAKMKQSILSHYDNIVIIANGKYNLVNSYNNDRFLFKRITVGQPKFVLTNIKSLIDSPQDDGSITSDVSISKHTG